MTKRSGNTGTFSIRPANAADAAYLPAIEQSAGELFACLPDLAWLAKGENRSVASYRMLIDGGWAWVAEDETGERCAFLAARQIGDALYIDEFAVALPWQRHGIGTALMGVAIDAAISRRLSAVTLTTFIDVAWNAPAYARAGFRRLDPAEIGPALRAILDFEAAAGLPADRRCAMRLDLR
jgi:GNAT superfamily N-acetyltransferase